MLERTMSNSSSIDLNYYDFRNEIAHFELLLFSFFFRNVLGCQRTLFDFSAETMAMTYFPFDFVYSK